MIITVSYNNIRRTIKLQLPNEISLENSNSLPVIETSTVLRVIASFETWLSNDNKLPFILAGPEGCGKGFVYLPIHPSQAY